jgi:SAM-dependent methyltransferase
MSLDLVRAAFDATAPTYEADFTGTVIGRLQRAAIHRYVDPLFPPGARILDLGCGAGEDAVHFAHRGVEVHGIDLSPAMVETARQRARREGLSETIHFETLPIEHLEEFPGRGYAGAFSSFGPLNCVRDLRPVAKALAERLHPGALVALCFMNRFCLWETLFYLLTLQLDKAIRRFSGPGAPASVGPIGQRSPPRVLTRVRIRMRTRDRGIRATYLSRTLRRAVPAAHATVRSPGPRLRPLGRLRLNRGPPANHLDATVSKR